jgi:hypothetical protein
MTAVPKMVDRGAFMSVNASLQQISGGVASILAEAIVVQHSSSGPLESEACPTGYLPAKP